MSTESAPVAAPVVASETPATPATPASPAPDTSFDTRLAAISKREREIQQQAAAFKAEKAGMISKAELAALWKSDRAKVREYLGASPDEWTIKDPTAPPPVDPVAALRAEMDAMKKEKADNEQASLETQFKQGITSFVAEGADAYELISAYNATETVWNFMVEYYQEHEVELSLKDACDYIENYLYTEQLKGTKTKKIGSLFQQSQEPGKQPSPTLTGTSTANPVQSTQRRMTPEESLKQAAQLIKWN
jgi:hypothetical protein